MFTVQTENNDNWKRNLTGEIVTKDNINSYIPELKLGEKDINVMLNQILAIDKAKDSWQEFFSFLEKQGHGAIVDLIKNTNDLSKLTGDDLVQANQKARASALAHNEALKQQTLGAKAASVAMKGLSMVGNMLAFAAISKGIEILASAIDKHIINPAKYAKEAMQEAQQAIDDSQNTLKTLSDTINNNKDRFLELSQGVDRFSNNKLLSEEDYAEFLSISQEIADVAPDLVEGYDDQGNALIRLGENAKETEELLNRLLELQQKTANETLADNIDEIADGVRYDVESTRQEIEALERELEYVQNNTSSSDMNIIDTLEKHGGLTFEAENYNKYGKKMEQALTDAGIEFTVDSNINSKTIMLEGEILEDNLKRAQEYFDLSVEIQERAYRSEEAGLKRDLAEKEKLYNEHYSKMTPNLQAWVKDNYQYQALGENQKLVDSLIPSLDWNKIVEDSGLESFSAHSYQKHIEDKIIKPLMEIPDEHQQEVNNMIQQLLSFEDGDLDILQVSDQLQATFKKLNIEIDLSPIISNEQEAKDKLQNSIETIAKGSDFYTGSGAQVNAEDYATLQEYTKDFTAEQAELWEKTTLGAQSATEAINRYEESLKQGLGNEEVNIKFKTAFNAEEFSDTKEKLLELAKSGELTPYTLSSTSEYNKLLEDTGLTAEQVYKKIMKIAHQDMSDVDWSNTLSNARSQISKIQDTLKELDENGESSSFVDAIISNYPQLLGYIGDETEMRKQLNALQEKQEDVANQAYTKLVENSEVYYNTLKTKEQEKLNTMNNTANSIIKGNKTLVDILGKNYKIDLGNYKSIADAKAKLETELIKNSASAWSKFYQVQIDTNTGLAKVLGNSTTVPSEYMGADGDYGKAVSKYTKAQNEQKKAAQDTADIYNGIIASLNDLANNIDITAGLGDGSGSGSSATKSTTKFSQVIDWCAETISNLSNKITNLNAKLENTSGLEKQIKYYKELLNAQNALVKGYSKTENKYKKQYNKALKKLSKEDRNKVENGTYSIEQFSGKSKGNKKSSEEKRYNNIQNALEARDKYFDAQTETVNAKQQFQEYAEALASVRWENATEKVEKLNDKVSLLDTKMSNASGYEAKNKVLKKQLDLQKKILDKQQEAYDDTQSDANAYYKKISSKYKKNKNSDGTIKTKGVTDQTQLKYIKIYNAYVKQLAEDSIKLAQAEEDYKASVKEASITRAENIKADYDNKLALIDAKANELDSQIALAEAKGQVASVEYYKQLEDISNQRVNELESEKKQLEKQLDSLKPYTDEWYEVKRSVIEVDEAIADETVNAVENINKQIEAMKGLTQAKNEYLSGTVGTLDWLEGFTDEEDYYNENGGFSDKGLAVAKGKLTKAGLYEQQAKNIQDNIDKLDEQYKNNQDDANYLKQRLELTQDYQDAMTSWYDEQQSLHDMYINNLKKESEALSDLIDKKKESLEADKSEYDYQKSIAEKSKNISDLEKQKAMLEGSSSEEDKAKLQKINVELEDAKQDLEDTQYEKQLERMEDALDGLQERFDAIIEKLDKEGAIPSVEEITSIVSNNEKNVEKGIKQIIKDADLDSLLGEKGLGGLNSKANELLTTSTTSITSVIETTNSWLEKIFNKDVGNNGNNGSNSNNSSTSSTTTSTEKNSGTSLFDVVKKQTSSIVQKKVKEFIDNNATKANKKKSEYGILNQKIYEITNGKILNKANRVKLAKSLGVNDTDGNGDITGVEAQKVVKLLEKAGFSSGGIVDVVRRNGDDGLATLKVGEAVLTPVQTDAFLKLADNLTPLNSFMDIIQKPKLPTIQSGVGGTTIDNINVEFSLPNVTDTESFKDFLQNDNWVNRYFDNLITNKTVGGNRKLSRNRL